MLSMNIIESRGEGTRSKLGCNGGCEAVDFYRELVDSKVVRW